jgi:Tol biopolymer transport system component
MVRRSLLATLAGLSTVAFPAEREPVLKQIAVPHPYYYREMYLPQLTSGPSSLAWLPDSRSLVYSMAGSLYRQELGSDAATELTSGPGYDYQPDASRDGRSVVYVKYDHDAMELWLLDLTTGSARPLTAGGHVNLEPRFSPDGRRVAFVSTEHNGRFHIFLLDVASGAAVRLTGEARSDLPRYYYSPYDHELSPVWTPDGSEIVFVSNRGHIHGTGGFFRMKAEAGAEADEIHYEETNWRARPDISPDGKRLVFPSYLGRPWHQLWVMPASGGDVFPLTYGEYDNTSPRWSPDGTKIAFISNRSGTTEIWIQEVLGGRAWRLETRNRTYERPMGRLRLEVLDASGRKTAARVSITGEDGRAYAPDDAWIHADDAFVRAETAFEKHYFHVDGEASVSVPIGRAEIEVAKGFAHRAERRSLRVGEDGTSIEVRLEALRPLPGGRLSSGDLHVHMNYGGAYRNDPEKLRLQAEAEDLDVVWNLIVNKEQRVPDMAYFTGEPDRVSTGDFLLFHSQEFHTSYWGHMGLLGLNRNVLLPDYAAYPNTAAASLYPANAIVSDLAREQGGVVGYVHPYEGAPPDPERDPSLTHELPIDVALGKVDYLEVMGFSDHKITASVWYRFLNSGFRLPAGAGTDAMANFASLRGPVGLNRVYVRTPEGPLAASTWLDSLRAGRSFVTNGPLLDFTLSGKRPGEEIDLPAGAHDVQFTASLRSIVPVEHFELVCNGEVVRVLELSEERDLLDASGSVSLDRSGWCLARAWNDGASSAILDAYAYATTNPVYVTVGGEPARSKEDDAYFVRWIDRIRESVDANRSWNTESERAAVLDLISRARAVYARRSE